MRTLMAILLLSGCTSDPVPVTWNSICTVYCGGQQQTATGTLCWEEGASPATAATESVTACEAQAPCVGNVRCSCTARKAGESCQTAGDMLAFDVGVPTPWIDECAGACTATEICWDSVCIPSSDCAAPDTLCYGICTDTDNDFYNCGACGRSCVGGQTCLWGVCV